MLCPIGQSNEKPPLQALAKWWEYVTEALVKAARTGVQIVCYSCHVEADSIKITGVVGDTSRFANM